MRRIDDDKIDTGGNMWASGTDGLSIFSPAGERLGIIRTDQTISNCEFGADGHLYITSYSRVIRVKVKSRKIPRKTA